MVLSESDAVVRRIGTAWKELRRGAAMGALRPAFFGDGTAELEPGQWDTLDLLVRQPSWRMSELADGLRVDPSTATRAVQRLLKIGLAERSGCADDGRVVLVMATDQGRSRHEAIIANRTAIMQAVLAEFDDGELRQLANLLDRFVGSLDRVVAGLHDRV